MRKSGSSESRTKRAFSCSRETDSLTRNVVRLCIKTVTAPIIRNEPIDNATMSSIKVSPATRYLVLVAVLLTVNIPDANLKSRNLNKHLVLYLTLTDLIPGQLNLETRRDGTGVELNLPHAVR